MSNRIVPVALAAALTLALAALAWPLVASSATGDNAALQAKVDQLSQQVATLQQKVATLEAIKPTFTEFMPNFSERFHVMHKAGEVGDWAVAAHEAAELERLLGVAKAIDPEKGQLMQAFIGENLHEISESIEHGETQAFLAELAKTVAQCNACHAAVKSPFIQVALADKDLLSYRHSHKLRKSMPPMEHHHGG